MGVDLAALQSEIDSFHTTRRVRRPFPQPDGLYHYCSERGLKGILGSQYWRAKNLKHMGDKTELLHAEMMLDQILNSHARYKTAGAKRLRAALTPMKSVYASHADAFAVCFSMEANDDGQWQRYGDEGRGYVIELDPLPAARGWHHHARAGSLVFVEKVLYDVEAQEAVLRAPLEALFDLHEKYSNNADPTEFPQLDYVVAAGLASNLAAEVASFKNPLFKDEHEVRFVQTVMRSDPTRDRLVKSVEHDGGRAEFVEFRPYPMATPYGAFLPVKSVRFGSKVNEGHARDLVRSLAEVGCFPLPEVRAASE